MHSRKDSRPPRGSCGRPHRSKRCGGGEGYPIRTKRVAGTIRVWAALACEAKRARARASVRGWRMPVATVAFFSRSEFACADALPERAIASSGSMIVCMSVRMSSMSVCVTFLLLTMIAKLNIWVIGLGARAAICLSLSLTGSRRTRRTLQLPYSQSAIPEDILLASHVTQVG